MPPVVICGNCMCVLGCNPAEMHTVVSPLFLRLCFFFKISSWLFIKGNHSWLTGKCANYNPDTESIASSSGLTYDLADYLCISMRVK